MSKRDEKIKKFGIDIVLYDEDVWKNRGYKINYEKGLLEKIIIKKPCQHDVK